MQIITILVIESSVTCFVNSLTAGPSQQLLSPTFFDHLNDVYSRFLIQLQSLQYYVSFIKQTTSNCYQNAI